MKNRHDFDDEPTVPYGRDTRNKGHVLPELMMALLGLGGVLFLAAGVASYFLS